jgi:hypothetical protein
MYAIKKGQLPTEEGAGPSASEQFYSLAIA